MNILIIFGTRPEAIKMSPLIKELKKINFFNVNICVTGQHRTMLDQVLKIFNIIPDYDLNIMKKNQTLTDITCNILLKLKNILCSKKFDLVLVHGDTTTTFASSLASFYENIPIAHVEAGLRTWNMLSPWPEEMNRVMVSNLAQIHFAPTETAKNNLLKQGIKEKNIFVTGNTIADALSYILKKIETDSSIQFMLKNLFYYLDKTKKKILITGHRRENFGNHFINIYNALKKISERNDIQLIFPAHLNPNIQKNIFKYLGNIKNIHLIPPLDYLPFIFLMQQTYLIISDSGGIQEEAALLGKPLLVTREITERPEVVNSGTARIVGSDYNTIILETNNLLDFPEKYEQMFCSHNLYGEGNVSEEITKIIYNLYK